MQIEKQWLRGSRVTVELWERRIILLSDLLPE